ncbi:IMPACT family protein [Paenalcaligenes suwonensis]|uniref:IMPACT family protein n=1 Tax=Paenalcaligenes suwonensis TaxID=1202713 RepID=UPI001408B798|nr:YigZ family protein [Paenalcaligenes suwonensis]NHC62545.1 YigZ family protein [Paenalcaligenes suwonensis]
MLCSLTGVHQFEEDIKRSRFLAIAAPVSTVEDAMRFLDAYSVPDATHNCWAYKIGNNYRFNDDGEPGGTAGKPILQAIEGQQCDEVVVLVIRWFGGVKLGTGGLVRAYGGVAAQCLRLADKREIIALSEIDCSCSFSDMALVRSRFEQHGVQVVTEDFDAEGVVWRVAIPVENVPEFENAFTNMTRGQGLFEKVKAPEEQ